ncbi:tetratricopeptide repeat protein [Sphaerobacter thermophilus]|uniref:Tetratricopeptide TPR_2 repeat protein n=1 Tax=Sphaerobacter thermophilus (strain ATCC 49802 / DSM 20745 / KCCM 41009 / NCIMB 13125 / S 6022) TaxID=479434 RepID=D1C350_SPHTD|nr:tetratricopeptide repeat protein [Sphaerobacter thermophilus]ACZ38667.1 Tetratricopeptide TPR_2 repeat protein [Sphaerobacter thermophilus DSM 20745]
MAKRKRSKRPAEAVRRPPPRELDQVRELLEQQDYASAREQLLDLADRPNPHPMVLQALASVAQALEDWRSYLLALESWHRQQPNDADVTLALGDAYMRNLRPVLALRTFESFQQRWPDHPQVPEVEQVLMQLRPSVDEMLAEAGLSGEEGLQLAALHEEIQSLMDQGRTSEARATAQKFLKRWPDFVPVLNNLTLVLTVEGAYDQAIATARRALEIDPENVHARGNLIRVLMMTGQVEKARSEADRLALVEDVRDDQWLKLAEAFSFVGYDERVLDVYERAEAARALGMPGGAYICHLAAVAAMNRGDEQRARQLWERALKLDPGMHSARENLADLSRPVGQRHAPWPFELRNWVSERVMENLLSGFTAAVIAGDEDRLARAVRRMLRQSPELKAVVPILLERGDSAGRTLAVQIAAYSEDPTLLEALHQFALSQRGTDTLRQQAITAVQDAGLLKPGQTFDMWIDGEWTTVQAQGFELHEEPLEVAHAPEVEAWLAEARAALQARQPERAETLFKQALEVEPGSPGIRTYLAQALTLQRRFDEAEALLEAVMADSPDYMFATLGLAQVRIEQGRYSDARAMLLPLLSRTRYHVDEYVALGSLMIHLSLVERKKEDARRWAATLERVMPDHPMVQKLAELARR